MKLGSWVVLALVLGSSAAVLEGKTRSRAVKTICSIKYPEVSDYSLWETCRSTLKLKVLDDEATANIKVLCQDDDGGIFLSFEPGVYVVEDRFENGTWKFVKILPERHKQQTVWKYGGFKESEQSSPRVQLRFHRVFSIGLSKPETTDWIEKINDTNIVPLPVKNVRVQFFAARHDDPEETGVEISFDPAEDRRCHYRVTYREEGDADSTINFSIGRHKKKVFGTRLDDFSTQVNVTVIVQAIRESDDQITLGAETSLNFTTPESRPTAMQVPELVENLDSMTLSFEDSPPDIFNVHVWWDAPRIAPDYYIVDVCSPVDVDPKHCISSNVTSNSPEPIPDVKLSAEYEVSVRAYSRLPGIGPRNTKRFVTSENQHSR